ncbi:MAG: hypothetical protein U9M97_05130 [Candidatus Hadarchaeota archaeon]|nr:hypothetical protein [Candidatus Hadarchaeota archaeon]
MKLVGKAFVAVLVLFGLLAVVAVITGAEAPEEAEVELKDIVIEDNGEEVAISLEDVEEYVMEKIEGEIGSIPRADHMEMFYSGAFRAALLDILKVWENEVPSRSDIRIVSSLPEPGSALCFQYITGTGPSMGDVRVEEGEFEIVLLDGTEVGDLSIGHLYELSEDITADDWVFEVSSISTGESYVVEVKADLFPGDLFELRKEVVFDQTASDKEKDEFKLGWTGARDAFQEAEEDYELFEGLEEPPPSSSVVVILIAIIAAIGILAVKI